MPNPTRPSQYPLWTQGNNSVRTQPTNGEQLTGFVPNQRPASTLHNWLFGIFSDWIAWLDFATQGGGPVSNAGHNILTGTTIQSQFDETDAFLSALGLQSLTLTPTSNPAVFTVTPIPVNNSSPLIFLDGLDESPTTDFAFVISGGVATLTFDTAPSAGQTPMGVALTSNSSGSSGGSSGSGGFVAYGNATMPVSIIPSVGVESTSDQRAIIFTESNGGVVSVSANPQVSPATKVGQELRLVGTSDVNAIALSNGNGLLINGSVTLGNGVSIDLYWNGSVWAESDRSN
jgi:hypothetical protein